MSMQEFILKAVELEIDGVDMTAYFRKLHTMRGVERLDLGLIEPDKRWDLDLPGYGDYKQLETAAPLPFKEPNKKPGKQASRSTRP